jgi:cytochrome c556
MKKLLCSALVAVGGLLAIPAQAQVQTFSKPEDAIRYRQSAYFIMGVQMGRINSELKAATPNVTAIQRSAGIIESTFRLPGEGYIPGSDKGRTKAKPEIFTDREKVGEIAKKAGAEIAKLNEVAKTGDIAAIRTQFNATADACDSCHDNFRNK